MNESVSLCYEQVHKDTYALVVSADNMTGNFYQGTNRSMLLINCLFRIGGAAVLLSNRSSDRLSSKYELTCTAHTNTSSSDQSYNSLFQEEDIERNKGFTTSKDLAAIASESLEEHLTVLTPMILPVCLKLRFVSNNIKRKLLYMYNIKPYMPNVRGSVDHFYNHVGAKPVQNAVQRVLKLSESDMEAPRMTLYRWGNTYSSSIWYELAYGEAKGRLRKGDRVWNIAYGSGFKCSSNIWSALRDIDARERLNPWTEEINQFPVDSFNMEAISLNFGPSN
ncbi:hypothetical protein Droror1_Dr00020707 [Drosera rotundifolia]